MDAASGGYYISAAANQIFASPTTLTGSIGVFSVVPTFQHTLEKLGVKVDGLGTTALAGNMRQDRALSPATRQILQNSGVDADRVAQVVGKAAADPLYPDDPTLPGNRRITIVLLKEKPVLPTNANP